MLFRSNFIFCIRTYIGTVVLRPFQEALIILPAQQVLVVLLIASIGVLLSPVTSVRGDSISTMATRAPTIRTSHSGCVQFGLFNYLLAVARAKADLPVRSVGEGGLACRSICEGGFNHLLDETFVKASLSI